MIEQLEEICKDRIVIIRGSAEAYHAPSFADVLVTLNNDHQDVSNPDIVIHNGEDVPDRSTLLLQLLLLNIAGSNVPAVAKAYKSKHRVLFWEPIQGNRGQPGWIKADLGVQLSLVAQALYQVAKTSAAMIFVTGVEEGENLSEHVKFFEQGREDPRVVYGDDLEERICEWKKTLKGLGYVW